MAKYDQEVLKLKEQEGKTYQEIANTLGLTYKQVNHAINRARKARKGDIEFQDKKSPAVDNEVLNYIEKMKQLKAAAQNLNTRQVKASIRVYSDKPIGVAFWSDWHLGAIGTDYELFQRDQRIIRDTEGLYYFGGGDYTDNYILGTPPAGHYEALIPPGMQCQVALYHAKQTRDKALALVRGCHDDWVKKAGDIDFMEAMCLEAQAVNLWHGGEFTIKLGGQNYLWRIRHKYKYQSSLNLENAMRRINEIQGPCDIAAEAHLHDGYIMERHLMGEYRVMVRGGSYKVWDEYGQKLAGYKGKPSVPVIILFPDKRKMVPVLGLETAIETLKGLRK